MTKSRGGQVVCLSIFAIGLLCLPPGVLAPRIALAMPVAELAVTTFGVGASANGIVIQGDYVWVSNSGEQTLTRLNVSDGSHAGGIFVGGFPQGMATDGANIWVAITGTSGVAKVRASDGAIVGRTTIGGEHLAVAVQGADVWVSENEPTGLVSRLRGSDLARLGSFPGGPNQRAIASDGSSIWVTNILDATDGSVTKLRVADGTTLGTFRVGAAPQGLAFDGENMWVSNSSNNSVTKLRASDGVVLGTFAVGNLPTGLLFDGSSLWVANSGSNTVMELRPSDGVILGVAQVGSFPFGLAFDGARVWVTNRSSSSVSRIERRLVQLLVALSGTGSGVVQDALGGINCPSDCSESYTSGTTVTLVATPAWDSVFAGWSGDADCPTGVVTLESDTSCTAMFNPAFRDVRRSGDINFGADLGGTGHPAINFTGSTGSAGDTWLSVYDETLDTPMQTIFTGSVYLSADVLTRPYNNKKGAGVLALYNEGVGKKGLALIVYSAGNTDTLVLATVDQAGKLTALKSASLGAGILQNAWYRLTMDVVVAGGNFTVTGKVFKHTTPSDPGSDLGAQVGGTLASGPMSLSGKGLLSSGEVGVLASAVSATVDSSVTNFAVGQ